MKKQYAVFGLGSFGESVAMILASILSDAATTTPSKFLVPSERIKSASSMSAFIA